MFGDNPFTVTFETGTCAEVMGSPSTSYKCYTDQRRQDCCATCEQHKLANGNNPGK